jgi:DtxR family Mn-dependent transcriptional regulator
VVSIKGDVGGVVRPASRAAEDYLKAIYRLGMRSSRVSTSELAEELGRAAPSVTNMVKGLAIRGLVEHAPYHGVRLTPAGREIALRILRRHRVIEAYLIEKLGYAWDGVHIEAERLEHAASDELIAHMDEALGRPDHDPHGSPIPAPDGRVESAPFRPLLEVPRDQPFVVGEVLDQQPSRLRRAGAVGLFPGARVMVTGSGREEGSLEVVVDGHRHTVDRSVAAAVGVRRA